MDNYFHVCPAVMSDGRIYTDFRQSVIYDTDAMNGNHLANNNEFGKYIYKHGNLIKNKALNKCECNTCWVAPKIHIFKTVVSPKQLMWQNKQYDEDFLANN